MATRKRGWWVVIGLLAVASLSAPTRAAIAQGSVESDRAALVALYHATGGPSWTGNANWLSDEPLSEWFGVRTESGRVIRLDLTGNGLSGPIPPALGNLSNLERLSLRDNQLSGPIPIELGKLANLQLLWIQDNALSGPIPTQLGSLGACAAERSEAKC